MEIEVGCRIVGDYIIGPKIGSGSFAEVFKSKHRVLGTIYAIKEIDKKHLNDNLRKEITILRNVNHPNIIRLFEAIETEERIYLVLEYCEGGDLGAYINRHGRVPEDVARHFMKHLAAGLRVLRENNLIHRDLKPQNLLLSSKEVTPLLKIGDFGFARYLTPQSLADTLCGSPLYMAPEIIQNQRYDAKADLWSVGAICYQLVIGKPPFDGNNQMQLFENVLKSTELRFPEGALQHLHPDYVEFCRSLLRRNPVERLTFEEFFNHRFLMGPRAAINVESTSQISQVEPVATDDQGPRLHQEKEVTAPKERVKPDFSVDDGKRELGKDHYSSTSRGGDVYGIFPNISVDKARHAVDAVPGPYLSQTRAAYSLDFIEKEYVLVHSNFASKEILTSSLGTSLKEGVATKACDLALKNNDKQLPTMPEMKELTAKFISGCDNLRSSEFAIGEPSISREMEGLPILHPSTRLQLIHQYVSALSDLAREKFNEGFFLESFSVELVVLALWKESLRICKSWLIDRGLPQSSSGNESACERAGSSSKSENTIDFTNPSSVCIWAEQGFINAFDGTEKLSKYLHDLDGKMGASEMPDAMEIIYQTAIVAGKNGAADEFVGNCESAAAMYTKALHLFSFIVGEAHSLALNPPFSLSIDGKQRILKYMKSLEYHLSNSQSSEPPSIKQLPSFGSK